MSDDDFEERLVKAMAAVDCPYCGADMVNNICPACGHDPASHVAP